MHVATGETVALVGESGSGKSTLLKTFNRLVEPTQGEVRVRGEAVDAGRPEELRRSIGYIQQESSLLPHWTVGRNVGLVPRLLGWPRERVEVRTQELLALVGLEPAAYVDRYPLQLSGGQRQRVAFARALAGEAKVVLMDEPFGALDPLIRHDMQREFSQWRERLGISTLMVTHDLQVAARLADRIAVMRDGEILQVGSARELSEAPATSYVQDLLRRGEVTI